MRKAASLNVLFLALIILLSACKTPSEPGRQPTTSQTPTRTTQGSSVTETVTPTPSTVSAASTSHPLLQVEPEELSSLRLTFWHPWSSEMGQTIDAIVHEFNESNIWGIQVFTRPSGGAGALVSKFEQNLDGSDLPNVLLAPSEQILLWQAQQSLFIDLNAYIQDPQWGLTVQERSEIPPLYWNQDIYNGQQTGMPALRDMRVLFYNQSWARELGFFTPPQSFTSFSEQTCAAAASRKDIDGTGGYIIDTHPQTALSWILTGKPPAVYDGEENLYRFDSPQVIDVFTQLREQYDQGCAWISRLPDPYEYFADRQALAYSGSLQDIPLQSEWMRRKQNSDEWIILPFPVAEGKPVALVSSSAYAVLATDPIEQLASWLFIRWLILPRHQARLSTASGLLPVSASAQASLQDFRQTFPQWEAAQVWIPLAEPVPQTGSWAIVQHILEDAAWQTFQTFTAPEDIPGVIEQLDAMIPEVLSAKGYN